MQQTDTALIPLRGMERCAIFENREFFRTLQRSVLRDMLEQNRIDPGEYLRAMDRLRQPTPPDGPSASAS